MCVGRGGWPSLQHAIGELLTLPALLSRAELLVELALALCDTPPPAAAAADAAAAVPPAHVGGFLLLQLFGAAPEAQSAILSAIFDALAQEDGGAARQPWVGLWWR